ncbi:hypothetical protein NDU88_001760 [Pleurodeles waltl]|uniref:Uncharacterized protein n=1 Tax=Pleurodeles waltl TaxID=8319 RepID=A0AAV7M1E7_PLEWA|nr:hypothetical protein NDU88_001760 [Pleurodeles waltl]
MRSDDDSLWGQRVCLRGRATDEDLAQDGEPSLLSDMAANRDLRGSIPPMEPKLDAVMVEVNLLRADFGKISE